MLSLAALLLALAPVQDQGQPDQPLDEKKYAGVRTLATVPAPPVSVALRVEQSGWLRDAARLLAAKSGESPEVWRELQIAFDDATRAFANRGEPLDMLALQALSDRLTGIEPDAATRAARALYVRLEPRVYYSESPTEPTARIQSLYPIDVAEPLALRIILRSKEGASVSSEPFVLPANPGQSFDMAGIPIPRPERGAPCGTWQVEIAGDALSQPVVVGTWIVAARTLDGLQSQFRARLHKLTQGDVKLNNAKEICEGRLALLANKPRFDSTYQHRMDFCAFEAELEQEVAAIERGENPYWRRPGMLWRTYPGEARTFGLVLYAPQSATGAAKVPLVIALHGLGADESSIFDEICGPKLRELADKHGFLVACPNFPQIGASMFQLKHFNALVGTLKQHYEIDEDRVYAVGHGRGAAAVGVMSRDLKDGMRAKLAGAICWAGGDLSHGDKPSAALVVGGLLDKQPPAKMLETLVIEAAKLNSEVQFRGIENQGHLSVVWASLDSTFEWLLARRRAP